MNRQAYNEATSETPAATTLERRLRIDAERNLARFAQLGAFLPLELERDAWDRLAAKLARFSSEDWSRVKAGGWTKAENLEILGSPAWGTEAQPEPVADVTPISDAGARKRRP